MIRETHPLSSTFPGVKCEGQGEREEEEGMVGRKEEGGAKGTRTGR
jgi:hypothetical protein